MGKIMDNVRLPRVVMRVYFSRDEFNSITFFTHNAFLHGFSFLDDSLKEPDRETIAKLIYEEISTLGKIVLYVEYRTIPLQVSINAYACISTVIIEPYGTLIKKVYSNNEESVNASFYIVAGLKLTENFAIESILAEGF